MKLLLGDFLVTHDAMHSLQTFHYFYSQLTASGEPPRWLAYGLNSRPAGLVQVGSLSAASYPVAIAGWILGVRNANMLFVVSMLLEQFVLLVGLHLLGRQLYRSAAARVYVGIAAAATSYFWTQTVWSQRPSWLWPLACLFLLRFFAGRRLSSLWAALIVLALMFAGAIYAAALYVVVFLVFGAGIVAFAPAWRRWPEWRSISSRASIALGGALVLTGVSLFAIAWEGGSFTTTASPGRVPGAYTVGMEMYLRYARPGIQHYLEFLYAAPWEIDLNVTAYAGLVTLALAFYGLFRQRGPVYRALWVVTLTLVGLTLSNLTFVAPLLYHVPPMNIFRHLGFVVGLVKLFLILLAGYGLDAIVHDRTAAFRRLRQPAPSLEHVGAAVLLLVVVLDIWVFGGNAPYVRPAANLSAIPFTAFHYVALAILAGLIVALSVSRRRSPAYRAGLVVVAATLELSSYQTCLYYSLPVRDDPALHQAWIARSPVFQTTRFETRSGHPHAEFAEALRRRFGTKFPEMDGFLGLDSCTLDHTRAVASAGVVRLLHARQGLPLDVPLPPPLPTPQLSDRPLARALGCGGPTVRFHGDVRVATTVDEAAALIRARDDIDDVPVLHGGLGPVPTSSGAAPAGTARATEYSANRTTLEVQTTGPGWLVLKQPFHPYWRATVNESEHEIWQANLAFMAIPLPGGSSRLQLVYDDAATRIASLWIAGVSSVAMLAACVALAPAVRLHPVEARQTTAV